MEAYVLMDEGYFIGRDAECDCPYTTNKWHEAAIFLTKDDAEKYKKHWHGKGFILRVVNGFIFCDA